MCRFVLKERAVACRRTQSKLSCQRHGTQMSDGVLSLCRNYQAVVALVVPKTCTYNEGYHNNKRDNDRGRRKGDSPSVHAEQLPASRKGKIDAPREGHICRHTTVEVLHCQPVRAANVIRAKDWEP